MIADRIPTVDVALASLGVGRHLCPHLLYEDLVANRLRRVDFGCRPGEARFEIADPPKNIGRRSGNRLAYKSI